jgi:hypothetical protein
MDEMSRHAWGFVTVGLVTLAAAGCDHGAPADADADAGLDAEARPEADAGAEADRDVVPAWTPGPLTLVAFEFVVLAERRCDPDGDGVLDNAIADLGSPMSAVVAMAVNTAFAGTLDDGIFRLLLHFPRLDDAPGVADGEVAVMTCRGRDRDIPADPLDDFSGDEAFYVHADSLDPCGEPDGVWQGATLTAGRLTGRGVPLGFGYEATAIALDADFDGELAPDGSSLEAVACGAMRIAHLGGPIAGRGGPTLLEVFLAGGSTVGIPGSGLSPDVDFDHDGLERFTLDADGQVESCIDGDGFTVIPGRDCWQDPRMADAFALTIRTAMTTARFAGREPGWELAVPGRCEAGMPEHSLFGDIVHEAACAGLDEPCDPLVVEPCCDPAEVCRGRMSGAYLCSRRCTPTPCDYGGEPGLCEPSRDTRSPEARCHPVANDVAAADCTRGTTGCTTEYGVATGTFCGELYADDRPVCLATCSTGPTGCDEAHPLCRPLLTEEDGFCAAE